MDNLCIPWISWCRLCGKESDDNNVSIHLRGNRHQLTADDDVKLSLKEAYEKYFLVQSSCEDLLPKHLCQDCYSLISSIMLFNEHVERVQEMYKFLVETPVHNSSDLKSVRLKFEVYDDNRRTFSHYQNIKKEPVFAKDQNTNEDGGVQKLVDNSSDSVHLQFDLCDHNKGENINFQNKKSEYVFENNQNTETNFCAEIFTTYNKEENWTIESDLSECEETNGVNNHSIYKDEVLYDEEHIVNGSQEDGDLFDAMPEDSFWGEDDGKTCNPSSTRNKNANTVRTSKFKMNQRKLRDIYCEKKTSITEDFVLDVTCAACEQKFDLYSKYCEHMETSHGKLSGVDKACPLCDRTLQTWYHLGRHMRYHMPLESRYPIKCPECDNRYTSTAQLEVHIKHKHKNEKPFVCEVCGFCGGTRHSLTQHMYIHTDEAPFECEVCKKRFKKRTRLNIHMDIHGPNKFVCSICGQQLNSRATLKNHLLVHSDKKRHKCDYCGKSFKQSKTLKGHLLLHVGLKPYNCSFCDLTYSNRSVCLGHMKKVHPNELALLQASGNKAYTNNVPKLETLKAVTKSADNLKPVARSRFAKGIFSCNYCDNKFSYRPSVRNHMKIKHPVEFASLEAKRIKSLKAVTKATMPKTPTEPVECNLCGRIFGNRKNCRNHMKRIHPDEMALLGASDNKKHTKNIHKVTKAADSVTPAATKYSDRFTNAFLSMEESTSDLDLQNELLDDSATTTPCTSNTVATNVQETLVNSSSPTVFLISIPGYPSVRVTQ